MFTKWWKFTTKKPLITSLIFILFYKWIRFIMISKIQLKSFQINLMLKLVMCLWLELLQILNFYLLGITFFLSNLWSQFFGISFVSIFPWIICTIFSIFFPIRIAKLEKFKQNKHVGEGGDLIQIFNVKLSRNYVVFTFTKETK